MPDNDTPITITDQIRIMDDANTAIYALSCVAQVCRDKQLYPQYLKEKLRLAKECIAFMETFEDL